MYSYLVHRYPIGFPFISSGTIPRGGARGQNLGHIYNIIDTMMVGAHAHVRDASCFLEPILAFFSALG